MIRGLFEQPYVKNPAAAEQIVRAPWHLELALRASRESLVLLKNEGNVLPLRRDLRSVLVVGPNAASISFANNRYGPYDPPAWELWQHYYAQAFLLASPHGVRRFSMFNEPNAWSPSISADEWLRRLRVCSDALQAGLADANRRRGTSLAAEILAPNTANGATKYDEWGKPAVVGRHVRLDETTDPGWTNLHVYNYQKYSMYTNDTGSSSGYVEVGLRRARREPRRADRASGLPALPYKFAQTERADGVYPVQKNGTHYVQNGTSGVNQYGGATKAAEVFRLFAKASGAARDRHAVLPTLGGEVWPMVTRDAATGRTFAFVANRGTQAVPIELDLSEVGVPEGSPAAIEEVSGSTAGGVAALSKVTRGSVSGYTLPAHVGAPLFRAPAGSPRRQPDRVKQCQGLPVVQASRLLALCRPCAGQELTAPTDADPSNCSCGSGKPPPGAANGRFPASSSRHGS